MPFPRLSSPACLSIALQILMLSAAAAQSTVSIPSTGARKLPGDLDGNWKVDSKVQGEEWTGEAAIVLKTAGGWATPESGAGWIGPNHDQSNATRPGTCCSGTATYTLSFNVDDPESAQIQMRIAADDTVTMYLNGTGMDSIVYSTVEPTYASPVTHTLKHGALYVGPFGYVRSTMRFVKGQNTLRVEVLNTNGPTGLYIAVTPPSSGSGGGIFTTSGPSAYGSNAAEDPVDAASGQFYDTETDFRLGGPMSLSFERYYSSQLSKSGKTSALGANWMHTFDTAAQIAGTTARVLLFGGRVVTFANSAGAWQLTSPLDVAYQFAASGNNFQFLDPVSQWIYTFQSSGALMKIEDRRGNAITVTQGSAGPARVADNLGRSLTFGYGAGGGSSLASVTDQSGRSIKFDYEQSLLASVTDPLNNVTRYAYTPSGALLTRQTLPLGNAPTTQTYDANARVLTQTDPAGNAIKIAYDAQGSTATVTSPRGEVTVHKTAASGATTQLTLPSGAASSVVYDASGRPSTISDRNGATRRYTYHAPSGLVASVTDELGNTTSFSYTATTKAPFTFYDLTGIEYPGGSKATLAYDANGSVTSFTAPDGAVTRYAYDSAGRQTQVTGPMKGVTSFSWNNDGTLASMTDPLGNVTTFQYDSLKRVIRRTDPNGATAQFLYDANGHITSESSPGNPANLTVFDANGQRTSWTGAMGNQHKFTYSPNGKLSAETDPRDATTSYTYDENDRLARIENAAGEAVNFTYTSNGEIETVADNLGLRSTYEYDNAGRLRAQTDATGRTSAWAYDAAGNLSSTTTSGGHKTTYTYDARGSLLAQTNPLGEQTVYTRDAAGRLLTTTLPGGITSKIERDAAGRPVSLTSPNGSRWTFEWDLLGRLKSVADPLDNKAVYTYKGTRLEKVSMPVGSFTATSDDAGRTTKLEYSDGMVLERSYDAAGFLIASAGLNLERDITGDVTASNGIGVTRDLTGRIAKITYAQDKEVSYGYDAAGRLSSISDWMGGQTIIRYDPASRIQAVVYPNGVENTWDWDADGYVSYIGFGQLGSIALERDAAGRIISADRNLPAEPVLQDQVQEFSYGPASRINGATYDALGRLTAQDNQTYAWDSASRLSSFTGPVNSGTMTYDGLGALTSATANGTTQSFIVNYATSLPSVAVIRSADEDQQYFIYTPGGELLYSINADDGARRFYHFDEMGNTVLLTNDAGEATDSYAITPYGEVADHPGATRNPFTFQGKYGVMQQAPGLYYMRSRYYDAVSARFLSPDSRVGAAPLESEPYVYANANPMFFNDPLGTWPWDGLVQAIGNGVKAIGNAVQNVFKPPKPAPKPPKAAPKPVKPPVPPPAPVKVVPIAPAPPRVAPLIGQDGAGLIGQDGAGLIGQDGAGLIGQDGAGLIGQDGAGLIGQDGAGLIGQDGAGLIGQDGAGLIGQDGAGLIGQDGAGLIGQDGAGARPPALSSLRPPLAYRAATPAPKAKNNKK